MNAQPSPLETALEQARKRRALPSPRVRRELRRRLGISQEVIAQAVGVSRITLLHYEFGRRRPSGERLERYLDVLDRLKREGLSA